MVKHNQTIHLQKSTNCLCVFDHFVGLALKGLIRGHTFITSTKNDQFSDPHPTPYQQKETTDLLFKNNRIRKHVANLKNPQHTPSLLCAHHECMAPKHTFTMKYRLLEGGTLKGKVLTSKKREI